MDRRSLLKLSGHAAIGMAAARVMVVGAFVLHEHQKRIYQMIAQSVKNVRHLNERICSINWKGIVNGLERF